MPSDEHDDENKSVADPSQASRLVLKYRLTKPKWYLEHFDAQTEKVRNAVIPLYEMSGDRPTLTASGTLVEYNGTRFLITAAHALPKSENNPLAFFGHDGILGSLDGTYFIDEEIDIASLRLDAEIVAKLVRCTFLPEWHLGATSEGLTYAGVAGFPATANRINSLTVKSKMLIIGGVILESGMGSVRVAFDKKRGATDSATREHVTPADPFGMSGGAIFGMASDPGVLVRHDAAKLIGISTRWRRSHRQIEGVACVSIVNHLAGHFT